MSEPDTVNVPCERRSAAARLPVVSQPGDVAADVYAAEATVVPARGRQMVATDLVLELPAGFRARLHSRSGLSWQHGIEVGAGLIDQGFRHPVGVLLYNHSDNDFEVVVGERIAQICLERYTLPTFEEVPEVSASPRTEGWGSSGR